MPMDILPILAVAIGLAVGFVMGAFYYRSKFALWLKDYERKLREDAIKKSRAVLGGKFTEQLAPYLPGFKYDPTEARFLGTPIDFIVFKGMAESEPEEIVFVEVKTGKSKLSEREKKLRETIENKRVRWEEYRFEA